MSHALSSKCCLANARPELDFNYRSKSHASCIDSNATQIFTFHGLYFPVAALLPSLCDRNLLLRLAVQPMCLRFRLSRLSRIYVEYTAPSLPVFASVTVEYTHDLSSLVGGDIDLLNMKSHP